MSDDTPAAEGELGTGGSGVILRIGNEEMTLHDFLLRLPQDVALRTVLRLCETQVQLVRREEQTSIDGFNVIIDLVTTYIELFPQHRNPRQAEEEAPAASGSRYRVTNQSGDHLDIGGSTGGGCRRILDEWRPPDWREFLQEEQ